MHLRIKLFLFSFLCFTLIRAQEVTTNDSILKKIKDAGSAQEKIKLYNQLSKLYWYTNPSRTLEYGQSALDLAQETENDTFIIDSRINIGIGYLNLASYDKAMEQFMLSLALSEKAGYEEGMANSSSNIAIIYDYLQNYEKSEEFYLKALKINKERKYNLGIIGTLNNLGILFTKTNKYEKALEYYKEALVIEKADGEEEMLAITLSNIGDVYDHNGDREKALEYYRGCLSKGTELNSSALIIASLINIGRMKSYSDADDSALYYFNEAAILSKETGYRSSLKDIYLYISEVYEKKSDLQNALDYYKKYAGLKDSIISEESNNKITELQIKYETEAKQKENELLQNEKDKQIYLRNFFIVVSVLVIMLAIIIFRNYRKNKKSNVLLLEKNDVITKQKEQLDHSLMRLRESEELYRSLVNTSPDGIIITDMNANITFISPALLKIYAYSSPEEVLGKKTLDFIAEPSRKKAMRYFQCLLSERNCSVIEIMGIRGDRKIIDIEINGGSLKDEKNEVVSLFFIFREITQRKLAEEKQREQQKMILHQQQEIAALELQKKEQENINLKNDLEFKNRELASKAMFEIQNNELIDTVIEQLKELENRTENKEGISQSEIRTLINNLKSSVRHDRWKEFETHFTQVHKDFYSNLQKHFPDLTSNEKKLCAFLRLNLSTKEISEITSKSIHSINVARTRLRQKLGMTGTDDNLSAFLSRF